VGVEVVQDQHDPLGGRVLHIDEIAYNEGEIERRALGCHHHVPPAASWLCGQEQIGDAVADVRVVLSDSVSADAGLRRAHLTEESCARLVQADLREAWVVRVVIHSEQVFHLADEGGVALRR
jgi:hypothetical protein